MFSFVLGSPLSLKVEVILPFPTLPDEVASLLSFSLFRVRNLG
jgi:hypothetical protein